jgi:hypothetical protein
MLLVTIMVSQLYLSTKTLTYLASGGDSSHILYLPPSLLDLVE